MQITASARLPPAALACAPRLCVQWASTLDDIRRAQRLRYQVFVEEMGAVIEPRQEGMAGIEEDRFDAFCDHLLVKAVDDADGEETVVGTYRVLSPEAARRAGGYYSDTEFDLAPLARFRDTAVELGRSCVHSRWRRGGVVMMLWNALGRYMRERKLDTMIGCASVSLADGGAAAKATWARINSSQCLHAAELRVRPRKAYEISPAEAVGPEHGRFFDVPTMLKGYLRCGARVLGPPAYDEAFNTADFPLMMRLVELQPMYRQHFMGDSE